MMKEWNADEIKQLRTRLGITQKALSKLLGVTKIYVGMLERNEKTPSMTLKLLLNYVERDLRANEKGKGGRHGWLIRFLRTLILYFPNGLPVLLHRPPLLYRGVRFKSSLNVSSAWILLLT